jgi:hypothetical protein
MGHIHKGLAGKHGKPFRLHHNHLFLAYESGGNKIGSKLSENGFILAQGQGGTVFTGGFHLGPPDFLA